MTGMSMSKEEFETMFEPEDLLPELEQAKQPFTLGYMIHHPLVLSVPHFDASNKMVNKQLLHKKEGLAKAEETKDWSSYVFIHERPYRVEALSRVLFDFEEDDPKVVWPLVAQAWMDSENIRQAYSEWEDIWNNPVPKRSQYVMSAAEQKALKAMPDMIRVHRGIAHEHAASGMSWTIDTEKAEWFSKRFANYDGREPQVVRGMIKRADVIAYFTGRGESEIVAFPEDVDVD